MSPPPPAALVLLPQLGSVFSILGVLIVVATSCLATYFITVSAYTGPTGVSSPLLIVFVAFIISFVIGSVFMQVWLPPRPPPHTRVLRRATVYASRTTSWLVAHLYYVCVWLYPPVVRCWTCPSKPCSTASSPTRKRTTGSPCTSPIPPSSPGALSCGCGCAGVTAWFTRSTLRACFWCVCRQGAPQGGSRAHERRPGAAVAEIVMACGCVSPVVLVVGMQRARVVATESVLLPPIGAGQFEVHVGCCMHAPTASHSGHACHAAAGCAA